MTDIVIIDPVTDVVSCVDEINHEHELFTASMRTGMDHAIRCGQLLIEQKDKLEHGEWLPWIMANCAFSNKTAEKYMTLASNSNRGSNLPDLPVYPSYQTAKQIEQATSIRSALKILAEEKKASKPQPPPPEKVAFSWMHEENIQAMYDGMRAMKVGIAILLKADKDLGVARHLLNMMRKFMAELVGMIDERFDDNVRRQ